jgi:hypothetical protein
VRGSRQQDLRPRHRRKAKYSPVKTSDAKPNVESQGEEGTGERELDGGGGPEKVGLQTARAAA